MSSELHENRLFLGNPGTGKSTLINCLVGNPVFQSGASWGHGLTQDFQRFECNGITYMDTPGLANTNIIEQAAHAVTTALRHSGSYKLFFVVRFENGHVVPEDLSTMESVLDSIELPNVPYSVIVNNLSKNVYDRIPERGADTVTRVITRLVNSGKYSTTNICLVPTLKEFVGKTNQVMKLPKKVFEFIEIAAPVVVIQESNVKSIGLLTFQQQTQRITRDIETIRQENLALLRRIEELECQYVRIDVSEIPSYPVATVVHTSRPTAPSAPYHAHPSRPVENKDDCNRCLALTACCICCGPIGMCCYIFLIEDDANRR